MISESREVGNDLLVLKWKNGAFEIRRYSTRGVIVIESGRLMEFIAAVFELNDIDLFQIADEYMEKSQIQNEKARWTIHDAVEYINSKVKESRDADGS